MDNRSDFVAIIKKNSKPMSPIKTGVRRNGSLRHRVRAVLFDIYGTLFISGSGDISGCRDRIDLEKIGELLSRYGISMDPATLLQGYFDEIERVHTRLRGGGVDYPEVRIEKVWMNVLKMDDVNRARKFAVEYESVTNPVWPMPFLEELLINLKKWGILMGIVSNAQFFTSLLFKAFQDHTLLELGFVKELILYSYVHQHAKPSVYLFGRAKIALQRRNVLEENVLYTGNDILNDILPARRTGFQTALFAGDKRSLRLREDDSQCVGVYPDITVTNLRELSEYVCRANEVHPIHNVRN